MKVCIGCGQKFTNETWQCTSCNFEPEVINGVYAFAPELASASDDIEPDFEGLYKHEVNSFWFRYRNSLIIRALQLYFPNAKNFLEIGCGTGFVLSGIESKLPRLSLFGSEIYCKGLEFAKKRLKRTVLFQMDACKIPFENEFDVIGAFDVLEHIQDDHIVLREMFKSVKNGGGVILTVPQHQLLWSFIDEISCHKRRYSMRELKTKLEAAGFGILYMTSFVTFLFPFMILSRFQQRYSSKKKNRNEVQTGLQISPMLNVFFENICKFEEKVLRSGVSFPFGGSLLAVAVKRDKRSIK